MIRERDNIKIIAMKLAVEVAVEVAVEAVVVVMDAAEEALHSKQNANLVLTKRLLYLSIV
jgi:hypothetical protein